jgi:toxin YhaV
MVVNESRLRFHAAFELVLDELAAVVAKEKERDPEHYKQSPRARLLARIYRSIMQQVPGDPQHASFHQGSSSGYSYQEWKRAKLGDRYRLFFKHLKDDNVIVFSWISSDISAGSYLKQMDAHRLLRTTRQTAAPSRPADRDEPEPRGIDVTY